MSIPCDKTFSLLPSSMSCVKVKVKYQGHSFCKNGRCGGIGVSQTHFFFCTYRCYENRTGPLAMSGNFVNIVTSTIGSNTQPKQLKSGTFTLAKFVDSPKLYFKCDATYCFSSTDDNCRVCICIYNNGVNSFPKKPLSLCVSSTRLFENTVEKAEIAHSQQILFFLQCFLSTPL